MQLVNTFTKAFLFLELNMCGWMDGGEVYKYLMKHTYFPGATNALHYLAGGEYTGRCKERGSI